MAEPRRPLELLRLLVLSTVLILALTGALEIAVRLGWTWISSSALAWRRIALAVGAMALAGAILGLILTGLVLLVRRFKAADRILAKVGPTLRWSCAGAAVVGVVALIVGKIAGSALASYLGEVALVAAMACALGLAWLELQQRFGLLATGIGWTLIVAALTLGLSAGADRFRLTRHYRPLDARGDAPNILLISIDTLRADRLGAYGYRPAETPNLDRLAADGVLFERAYSHSSWTRPGFGSLMTSLYPSEHGAFVVNDPEQAQAGYVSWDERVYNGPLKQEVTTLAEAFDRAGYFNLALQSNWHASQFNDFDQGFDIFLFDELRRQPMSDVTALGKGWKQVLAKITGGAAKSVRKEFMPSTDLYRGWRQFVERGLARPFFIWVNFLNVHDPYRLRDYSQVANPLDAPVVATYEANDPEIDIATLSRAYDSEITWADAWIGRMLEDLRSRGLLDSTLVVVTADHGEELGDHDAPLPLADGGEVRGRFHGHTLFREQVHVPWIMRFPEAIAAGRRIEQPVPHLDFAPTLADYAGARPGADWRGRSLRSLVEAAGEGTEAGGIVEAVFAERTLYGTELKSITTGETKAVWNTATGEWRFFDLIADPAETVPLNDPERQAELIRRLTAFGEEMGPLVPEGAGHGQMSADEIERLRALGYVQ